jgi:hypothetical protein
MEPPAEGAENNEGHHMPDLTGPQLNRLSAAIAKFLGRDAFTRVLNQLEKDYQTLSRDIPYGENVASIVQQAAQQGWVGALLRLASEFRPNSPQLAELYREVFGRQEATGTFETLALSVAPGDEASLFQLNHDDDSLYGGAQNLSHGSVGSIHLHVDGANAGFLSLSLLNQHRAEGFTSELNRVVKFQAGSQRRKDGWQDVYAIHTPGANSEELDFFSTTRLHAGPRLPTPGQWEQIRSVTRDVLTSLHHYKTKGLVVELERVIAVVDHDGTARVSETPAMSHENLQEYLLGSSLIFAPTAQQKNAYIPMYELHFSINVDKAGDAGEPCSKLPPMDLETLSRTAERLGLEIGGWFLFHDPKRWAYRSNGFSYTASPENLERKWKAMQGALSELAKARNFEFRLRLLVEESLGVWKSPFTKYDDDVFTVQELATWEKTVAKDEFWVVAPNFLGDQDKDVQRAVLKNISKGVTYRYFLRSNADAVRWSSYKQSLMRGDPGIADAITNRLLAYVVSLNKLPKFPSPYFIANPGGGAAQEAMMLKVDPFSQRIYGGTLMPEKEAAKTIKMLRPWKREKRVMEWREVDQFPGEEKMAVMHLRYSSEPCRDSANDFDRELAIEISKAKGEVFSNDAQHLVAGFLGGREAIGRAVRFVRKFRDMKSSDFDKTHPTIAIDWGPVQRGIRSFGLQWEGKAIRGARDTVEFVKEPGTFLSRRAAEKFQDEDIVPAVTLQRVSDKVYKVTEAAAQPVSTSEPARGASWQTVSS